MSALLARIEKVETTLSRELKEIRKVLREIEDNTHPEGDSKSALREDSTEKVSFEVL